MDRRVFWRRSRLACVCAVLLCAFVAGPAAAETRSLKLYFLHTKERAEITYKRNGRYLPDGLNKLNRFLRDWRRNEPTRMDPRLFDLMWEVYRESGSNDYFHVVSAYRSPQTNAMLRKRSGGVASKSQHTLGKAIDFYLPDVPLKKLRRISMKAQVGGVGYYPRSGSPFIHLDVGSVRSWPRMGRQELAEVFPDGKTLHLPKDGKPLPGYQQAMADYKARVTSDDIQIAGRQSSGGGGLFGGLFRRRGDQEQGTPAPESTVAVAQAPAAASAPRLEPALIPTPQARPVPPAPSVVLAAAPAPEPPLEVALAPASVTLAAALPDTGPVPAAQGLPVELAVAAYAPAGEATGKDVKPGVDAGTRVTLASASSAATAGAFVLPPDNGAIADALTELAFVPQPASRPQAAASEVVAAMLEPQAEQASGRPVAALVPDPARFGSNADRDEAAPLHIALAPPSATLSGSALPVESAAKSSRRPLAGKSPRPDANDAAKARSGAIRTSQLLPWNLVTRRTFAPDRVIAMQDPVQAPDFVSLHMRSRPEIVHIDGFSVDNRVASADRFSGRAVRFMTVARFERD